MESSHRLAALVILWIALAGAAAVAITNSIFLQETTVIVLVILLMGAGLAATFFISRIPPLGR